MSNSIPVKLMKLSLISLSLYFLSIAIAHMTAFKVPLLFVYFNVPSNTYQDNIIAFLAFGWAVFFFTIAIDPLANLRFIKSILIAAAGAVAGLSYINLSTDFTALAPGIEVWPFWAQTLILLLISIWLLILLVTINRQSRNAKF